MTIITAVFVLLFIVVAFWAVNTYIANGLLKNIFNIFLVIVTIGIVLSLVGWLPNLNSKV